jgi:c-di-GMP-binding flagellar brake protein YcgR
MKDSDNIKAGEKILLEVDDNGSAEDYLSKVEEIIDENTFVVTRPIDSGHYTYLTVGQIIRIVYYREDAMIYFDAQVTERIKNQESISAVVSAVSERYKLQRRNYFRLNIMVQVDASAIESNGNRRKLGRFDTVDISGGGLKIASSRIIEPDTMLEMIISIPALEDKSIKGKVIRSCLSERYSGVYEVGVEFVDMHQSIRQAIIKFIFTRQRELLKRGVK